MSKCVAIDCDKQSLWKDLCQLHYHRQYREGDANWQPTIVKGVSKKRHPLYNSYWNMRKRCYNSSYRDYKHYGGRGIGVCDRWMGKDGFDNFIKDMGDKPTPKHSIERKDNNLGYSPENCRWADKYEQAINQRHITRPYIQWWKTRSAWRVRVQGKYLGMFDQFKDAERARDAYLRSNNSD